MEQHTLDLFRKILRTLEPPPEIKLSEWADRYRYLSSISSAEPGKWSTDRAPYQRDIMNAIVDVSVSKVVIMSGAQIGKTDAFILNALGYYMHYDPCPIMVMQPTLQLGEAFAKDRLSPMLADTPVLSNLVNDKSRTSGNTILQKIFPGGHVTIVGANSPVGLRSRPIRVLFADEVDGYPITAGKDGDPLLLAEKRQSTFWNKKEVLASTPTIEGISRIKIEYENSTQEEWTVPCPDCGEFQPLLWGQVHFDKTDLSEISYICAECGTIHSEVAWKQQYINGKYIAKFPERRVRGFHLNSLASLFVEWRDVVEKFLLANEEKKKGNIEPLKVWTNTELGETWEEEGEQIEQDDLYNRRELYGCQVPNDVLFLTAGIDTQDDRFEIEVVGWGEEKESWGIIYHVIYGDLKEKHIWQELDDFLLRTFTKADGSVMQIQSACIDSGGHFPDKVLAFCKPRFARRVFAIKGRGGMYEYIPKPTRNNRVKAPLFSIGVDVGKALMLQRLSIDEPGPNYCHFPADEGRGYTDMYFKGLTAETMVLTYKKGRPVYVWKLKDNSFKRNEPWDVRNYATAALEIAAPPLIKKETKTPPPVKRGRRSRSKGVEK